MISASEASAAGREVRASWTVRRDPGRALAGSEEGALNVGGASPVPRRLTADRDDLADGSAPENDESPAGSAGLRSQFSCRHSLSGSMATRSGHFVGSAVGVSPPSYRSSESAVASTEHQ